jgi:uncharacterized delta-60 repeat protein
MKKLFFIILIVHYSLLFVHAQVIQDWVNRYNGPDNDWDIANSIAKDNSGNIYVTGYSKINETNSDYCTIKYSSSGVRQWVQRYNGPGNSFDAAYAVAVDGSGNILVTGGSTGTGTYYDYATIKYNSSGVLQWVQRYNGPGNVIDVARSISIDYLGNIYVTGYSGGSGTNSDYCTIKYNSAGVQQWFTRYNGPGNGIDEAYSLSVDGSSNVYITGNSRGSTSAQDYATIKYNSSGILQWAVRYNGPGNNDDLAKSIAVDVSGNVFITGSSLGSSTGSDIATLKYNSSGTQQWFTRYNGPGNSSDDGASIAVDISGNVYVTGGSTGSGTGFDYATIKYNPAGVMQMAVRYNGAANDDDEANSIALDSYGNMYVTGYSWGSSTGIDCATVKYNSSGVQLWAARYNGPGNIGDAGNQLLLDGSGNVFVTGSSIGSGTSYDYVTIKYSQIFSGLQPVSGEVPKEFSLFQNYPNPFNPVTNIKFNLPKSGNVILKVYDNKGGEAATLVNEFLQAGSYTADFEGTKFASGVYFYSIITDDFVQTRKMMLVK